MAYERAKQFCMLCDGYSESIQDTNTKLQYNPSSNVLVQELSIYYERRDSCIREAMIALEPHASSDPLVQKALESCTKCRGGEKKIISILQT